MAVPVGVTVTVLLGVRDAEAVFDGVMVFDSVRAAVLLAVCVCVIV